MQSASRVCSEAAALTSGSHLIAPCVHRNARPQRSEPLLTTSGERPGEASLAHPSVRGCDRSPDGTSTSPEADPPVVDVSDHGVTIIRPHRRSKR